VQEVVKEMIELKRADKLSDRYINQLSYDMKRFTSRFCNRIWDVRGTDVDAWLRELKVGPRTRNNLRASIQVLFNYAISRKYLEKVTMRWMRFRLRRTRAARLRFSRRKKWRNCWRWPRTINCPSWRSARLPACGTRNCSGWIGRT